MTKEEVNNEPEEEEIVCPQETLRAKCQEEGKIEKLFNNYQECNDRVNAKSKTNETCEEELFDYVQALDKCVAKTLWSKLKWTEILISVPEFFVLCIPLNRLNLLTNKKIILKLHVSI